MSIERDRLLSLIQFAQESARLRSKPASDVADHRLFAQHEYQMQGLPGIRLNLNDAESDDETWLAVQRLHETRPPDITSAVLRPWVQMTQSPSEEPKLRETTDDASLIAEGAHRSSASPPEQDKPSTHPEATVSLADYDKAPQVRAQLTSYLDTRWHPWAEEEKLRRQTIRLYSDLFTLKQQLEGGIVETQPELVWGVGVGIWNFNGKQVRYPVVGRLVELSLNPETAEVEIRPRDVDARIEVDWYLSVDNPGVAGLETAAKEFFGNATTTFSPFDRGTFEPLLRTAATNLDANGIYWPNEVLPEDRTLPPPDDRLKITDTWVLFARPRTNNVFLQDLEKLKKQAQEAETYPPAVAAIVTDPDDANPVVELPSFRGVSASYHSEGTAGGTQARDLYFPKPFNDEQERIVQFLESSDGVVVQGPPGTGKTHTIANVICHYLAEGKRVLVTSMKDPALAVLQKQLPEEIQTLAIALLTSERDGMKQFEHAINKIAAEVQSLDRVSTARAIGLLQESIDALHGKLAGIDRKIADWAKRNLAKITLEAEQIDPQDAAREVVENRGQFEWIPDALGITPEFAPQFSDADVVRLREARRALGADIDYLGASLPQLIEFPDSKMLLQVHQDLSQLQRLQRSVESGDVPALADASQKTLTLVRQLAIDIETLLQMRDDVVQAHRPWAVAMHERLRRTGNDHLLPMLEAVGAELEQAVESRKTFLERPVTAAAGTELDAEIADAVDNLAEGKSPFGLKGLFSRSGQKKQLESICVLGNPPAGAEGWKHVRHHLALLRRLRELGLRWNTLASELPLENVPSDGPEGGLMAAQDYDLYLKIKTVVKAESELRSVASDIFPNWPHAVEVADNAQRLAELQKALQHHLTKDRLASVWAGKESGQKVLDGRSGRIIAELRQFLSDVLGNPAVTDADMQTSWSALMAELSRVLSMSTHLSTVQGVCDKVEASGAPQYAALLRQRLEGAVDGLLPDNWRKAWRLRRLNTYLESIDAHEELKKLGSDRNVVESDLSRAYSDIVVKRTWLELVRNASPSIRSALQAYLTAVQHFGKTGRGKKAMHARVEARIAAEKANPAVPCWIMPHYRVSESLPAELGCFDLVIIDEASQSDITALPSLLRAKKILIVGDDKQVSPEGVGLDVEKMRRLMDRFLDSQVEIFRHQMWPNRSIYDLFKVVFATSAVMLKEHFRCVAPIIEYSKREFYNHELRPLRVPRASERLDPPLIDVLVEDGYRSGNVNRPEARFIVDEITAIANDPSMNERSIGVVSLLGHEQALAIWNRLTAELGPAVMERHRILCGDARTFQGNERDIMFLSMVADPNGAGGVLSGTMYDQRFNVAASRARDRMYLVRSVDPEELSGADGLRRGLISHFAAPFAQDEERVEDLRKLCESDFEREMYDELTERGYWVTPQVHVGQKRIDMVVEGHDDARLAIECDGDRYHGPEQWADDMDRERVIRRAGDWVFWRCLASAFILRREEVLDDLLNTLAERGIEPLGAEGAPRSVHTEHRVVSSVTERVEEGGLIETDVPERAGVLAREPVLEPIEVPDRAADASAEMVEHVERDEQPPAPAHAAAIPGVARQQSIMEGSGDSWQDANLPLSAYTEYAGPPENDPRNVTPNAVSEGLVRIIEVEGPVVAKRVYDIYLRGCGIMRMGREIKGTMNRALAHAIRQGRVVSEDEVAQSGLLFSVVRMTGDPPIRMRSRGPRSFEEIPPSELQLLARYFVERHGFASGSEEHLRAVLEFLDLKRLTTQVATRFKEIMQGSFPYVDEFLRSLHK